MFLNLLLTADKSLFFILKNKPVQVLFSLFPASLNTAAIHLGNKLTKVFYLSTFISV